jgi:hypothetical protein
MKYRTKLYVANVPQGQPHVLDVEAENAEKAADKANEYWKIHWQGPSPTTETVIHVYEFSPDGLFDGPLLFNLIVSLDSFDAKSLENKRWALKQKLAPKAPDK